MYLVLFQAISCCWVWKFYIGAQNKVFGVFADVPKPSKKKKTKSKSIWSKIYSFATQASMMNFLMVLFLFVLFGRLFKGEVLVILIMSVLYLQYLLWFSSKTEKSRWFCSSFYMSFNVYSFIIFVQYSIYVEFCNSCLIHWEFLKCKNEYKWRISVHIFGTGFLDVIYMCLCVQKCWLRTSILFTNVQTSFMDY